MTIDHDAADDDALQKAWENLTVLIMRKGFGVLWMRHFIADEFDKLCADPVMRARIGVEPALDGELAQTQATVSGLQAREDSPLPGTGGRKPGAKPETRKNSNG